MHEGEEGEEEVRRRRWLSRQCGVSSPRPLPSLEGLRRCPAKPCERRRWEEAEHDGFLWYLQEVEEMGWITLVRGNVGQAFWRQVQDRDCKTPIDTEL